MLSIKASSQLNECVQLINKVSLFIWGKVSLLVFIFSSLKCSTWWLLLLKTNIKRGKMHFFYLLNVILCVNMLTAPWSWSCVSGSGPTARDARVAVCCGSGPVSVEPSGRAERQDGSGGEEFLEARKCSGLRAGPGVHSVSEPGSVLSWVQVWVCQVCWRRSAGRRWSCPTARTHLSVCRTAGEAAGLTGCTTSPCWDSPGGTCPRTSSRSQSWTSSWDRTSSTIRRVSLRQNI